MIDRIEAHIHGLLDELDSLEPKRRSAQLSKILKLATDTATLEATLFQNRMKLYRLGLQQLRQAQLLYLLNEGRQSGWQLAAHLSVRDLEEAVALSLAQDLITVTPGPSTILSEYQLTDQAHKLLADKNVEVTK